MIKEFDSRRFTLTAAAVALVTVLAAQCLPGPSDDAIAQATAQDVKDAQRAAARHAAQVRRELAKTTKTTAAQ